MVKKKVPGGGDRRGPRSGRLIDSTRGVAAMASGRSSGEVAILPSAIVASSWPLSQPGLRRFVFSSLAAATVNRCREGSELLGPDSNHNIKVGSQQRSVVEFVLRVVSIQSHTLREGGPPELLNTLNMRVEEEGDRRSCLRKQRGWETRKGALAV